MYFQLRLTTHMLLKPAVLKGSLATGFGVGAGPGVPGDPKTSRIYRRPIVGSRGIAYFVEILCLLSILNKLT